ncbi:hypothetical protein H4R34_005302, partial [Dimargaris verticillata]
DCHTIRVTAYPTALIPIEQASQRDILPVKPIPAPLQAELSAGWARAQLAGTLNHYDKVEDFKWLRRQASPHWGLLAATDCLDDISAWLQLLQTSNGPADGHYQLLLNLARLPDQETLQT